MKWSRGEGLFAYSLSLGLALSFSVGCAIIAGLDQDYAESEPGAAGHGTAGSGNATSTGTSTGAGGQGAASTGGQGATSGGGMGGDGGGGAAGGGCPTAGLVLYWRFDETTGATAADSSGNGNDGTLQGFSFATGSVPGLVGSALRFDGATDHVEMAAAATQDRTQFSIALWVKTTESGNSPDYWHAPSLLGMEYSGTNNGNLLLTTRSGNVSYMHGLVSLGTSSAVFNSSVSVNDDSWHHLVMTNDGATMWLYVDGTLVPGSDTNTGKTLGSSNFLVGAQDSNGTPSYHHQGTLDELRIYDHALSSGDVTVLFGCRS